MSGWRCLEFPRLDARLLLGSFEQVDCLGNPLFSDCGSVNTFATSGRNLVIGKLCRYCAHGKRSEGQLKWSPAYQGNIKLYDTTPGENPSGHSRYNLPVVGEEHQG